MERRCRTSQPPGDRPGKLASAQGNESAAGHGAEAARSSPIATTSQIMLPRPRPAARGHREPANGHPPHPPADDLLHHAAESRGARGLTLRGTRPNSASTRPPTVLTSSRSKRCPSAASSSDSATPPSTRHWSSRDFLDRAPPRRCRARPGSRPRSAPGCPPASRCRRCRQTRPPRRPDGSGPRWKSRSCRSSVFPSGTNADGRMSAFHGSESSSARKRARPWRRSPRQSHRDVRRTPAAWRARSCGAFGHFLRLAAESTATMSIRGVITSATVVSASEKTPSSMSRSAAPV